METGWNLVIWDFSFVGSHLQFSQQSMITRGTNVFFWMCLGMQSGSFTFISHFINNGFSSTSDGCSDEETGHVPPVCNGNIHAKLQTRPPSHATLQHRNFTMTLLWFLLTMWTNVDGYETNVNAFAWKKCLLLVGKGDFRMAGQFVIFLFRIRLTQWIQASWKSFWRRRFITWTSPQMFTKTQKKTCSWPGSDWTGHDRQKTGVFRPWTMFHRFTCHAKQSRSRHAQRGSPIPNRPNCHPWKCRERRIRQKLEVNRELSITTKGLRNLDLVASKDHLKGISKNTPLPNNNNVLTCKIGCKDHHSAGIAILSHPHQRKSRWSNSPPWFNRHGTMSWRNRCAANG